MATPVANTVALTGNAAIDGLVEGGSWQVSGATAHALTYSLSVTPSGGGGSWASNPSLSTAVTQALTAWSNVANLSFSQSGSDNQFNASGADLAITLTGFLLETLIAVPGGAVVGLGVFPDPAYADTLLPGFPPPFNSRQGYSKPEGDIFLDNFNSVFSTVSPGSLGFKEILHEIGHALGLKHPFDAGGENRPTFSALGIGNLDTASFTVMSYNDISVSGAGNPITPMIGDIEAIQQIYGANMTYHTGNDVYTLDPTTLSTIWDAGGTDTLNAGNMISAVTLDLRPGAYSTIGGQKILGIAYNVTLENAIGGGANDTITGNDADNVIDGDRGADAMAGGKGNDTYIVDSSGDVVTENPGEGTDLVNSSVSYTLGANVENLAPVGNLNINFTGNGLDNLITGNFGDNILTGSAGNDTLNGGGGHDTLIGGTGNDTYVVGAASGGHTWLTMISDSRDFVGDGRTYSFDTSTGAFTSFLGIDQNGQVNFLLVNYQDAVHHASLEFTTQKLGTDLTPGTYLNAQDPGIDTPAGPGLEVTVDGRAPDQGVSGSFTVTAADFDYSGPSPVVHSLSISFEQHSGTSSGPALPALNGTLDINYGADSSTIVENANEGTDTVLAPISYTLPANVENLTLTGVATNINGTGNALDNVITGNGGNNVIIGNDGNDTLIGNDGNDTLTGGLGNDTLMGGEGDDTVIVTHNDGDDVLSGGNGFDTLDYSAVNGPISIDQLGGITHGSAGNDVIVDVFEYVIGTNFDDILSGGNGGDVLDGNGGNDKFFGNKGDDLMRGGDGDDTFFFSNSDGDDRLLGGNGFDVLDYSSLDGPVSVNQFAGITHGTAGNDTLMDVFEQIIGTAFNDVLSGGDGINSLKGGGGDDQIFANGGDDYVSGGPGNDTITMGPGNDTLDFRHGDQLDTITDFTPGQGTDDTITLHFYSGIPQTLAGLQNANMITQFGADTHIALNPGDMIVLQNVLAASLHQDDFVF